MKLGAFEAPFRFGLLVISDPQSKDAHGDWDASAERVTRIPSIATPAAGSGQKMRRSGSTNAVMIKKRF
jgi:hypothetical protein